MDDIVELVLQAWLWLLVLLPIGPVRGPRDARPDTPREKRMQYIVRPLVWMTLAGGAATGCAIGVDVYKRQQLAATIYIAAGHGGSDPGAVSGKYTEASGYYGSRSGHTGSRNSFVLPQPDLFSQKTFWSGNVLWN